MYSTSVTVAPFRRCDLKNLGVSHLCDLASPTLPQPRIWGHQVIQEYKEKNNGYLPDYIQNGVPTLGVKVRNMKMDLGPNHV